MQAVILNSGTGTRMGNLTKEKPKCMIEIKADETIISRQLQLLSEHGIDKIVITTGPFEKKLIEYCSKVTETELVFVHNDKFRDTNYIYSLYLAQDKIEENFLLLHGDLVFERSILEKVLSFEESGVLVNFGSTLPEKDFKARVEMNFVKEIGISIFDSNCYFCLPFYKIREKLKNEWFKQINNFIISGKTNVYAENALNNILKYDLLKPITFEKELCAEIDDSEDLKNILGKI